MAEYHGYARAEKIDCIGEESAVCAGHDDKVYARFSGLKSSQQGTAALF